MELYFLVPHWTKRFMQASPEPVSEGCAAKHKFWEVWWGGGHQWHQPAPVCRAAPATARLHPGPPKTSRITVSSRYWTWSPLFYDTQKGPVWVRHVECGSCCCRVLLSAPQHETFHSIGQLLDIPLKKEECTAESLVHSNLKCSQASVPMYL